MDVIKCNYWQDKYQLSIGRKHEGVILKKKIWVFVAGVSLIRGRGSHE